MVRRYGDLVEVRRGMVQGQEAPEQFLWRGRLYLVQAVLAHWLQTGAWWRSTAVRPVYGLDTDETRGTDGTDGTDGGGVPRPDPVAPGVTVLEDPGREVWRVEAAAGHHAPSGVVDLALDEGTGSWVLLRVHD